MIPRIIHYCWFSGDPYPAEVQQCIDSWHQYMPDWEFLLWDLDSISILDSAWLKECISVRKWAFAADYVRLYAIARYGGIYLDTDCMLRRSLTPFLGHQAFIGQEWYIHIDCHSTERYLTSHCFGAEPGHPFILRCLDYYSNRHFIQTDDQSLADRLRFDQTLLPFIQSELAKDWGYDPRPSQSQERQDLRDGLAIYPHRYFNYYYDNPDACCSHLALGGWCDYKQKMQSVTLGYRIRYHLDDWLRRLMDRLGYVLVKRT